MPSMLRFSAAAVAAAVTVSFAAAPAHAGIESCGNIDVTADATCKVEVDGECMAHCQPPQLEAACHAKLEADCETSCKNPVDVSCTASCSGDCEASCTAKPGDFDCEANCTGTCEGKCTADCSTATDSAQCEASCKATCSGECHGSCTGTPPSADCTARCQASCEGSCHADVNIDCQTKCQGDGFVKCQADFQEGKCNVQCNDPKGAVFCDGQFVDNGGNAQKCIDALDAYLKAHVNVTASATSSGSCSGGNTCEGMASAKATCHCSTPAQRSGSMPAGVAIISALGLIGVARMRRR